MENIRRARLTIGIILIVFIQTMSGQTYYKAAKATFRYTDMSLGTAKTLIVRPNTPYACKPGQKSVSSQIKKADINILFNWNTDFTSSTTNQYTLTYTVSGYSSYSGTSGLIITYTASLVLDNMRPQAYAKIDFTGLHATVNRFVVTPSLVANNINNTQVNSFIMADVYYNEEFEYDVRNQTLITNKPIGILGDNYVTFSWNPICGLYGVPPNYQFQLLRLYNNSESSKSDERHINAEIDWSKALTIETGNSLTEISLTMAEGIGYYIWRVRPIGNAFEGGIANDQNWGEWTSTGSYTPDDTYEISAGTSPYLFYFSYNTVDLYNPYNPFNPNDYPGSTTQAGSNDGDRNWIFKRSFIEGNAVDNGQVNIGESIGYANHLQMALQQQTRINTENKKLISQSIYDYSGRAALNVLPAPVDKNTLAYEPNYIKNTSGATYSAYDFDQSFPFGTGTPNYRDPAPMDSAFYSTGLASPSYYYSSNNDVEDNIPSAGGYPFSRTLFSKDGKNTAIESSMPGIEHRISSSNTKHTNRQMQSGVADMELVRVFGDEAPNENAVYKTITIDPNNSSSIAYISKEGKTIATCLSSPGGTNLYPLPSANSNPFSVSSDITSDSTRLGEYGFHASKTLALTEQTNVRLQYTMTPNVYSDNSCSSICSSCDYKITWRIIANNDEIAPITMTKIVTPDPLCNPNVVNKDTTVILPQGEYTIERIIEANTAPSGSSTTYLNTFVETAQAALNTSLLTNHGTMVDDFGVLIPGSPTIILQTVLDYIAIDSLKKLYTYLQVGENDTHKNIKVGCNTIRIPIWHCTVHTCVGADLDFESYLYNKYRDTTTALKNLRLTALFPLQGYALGEFNNVIQNMLNAGYACDKLWECWEATIAMYASQTNTNNVQPAQVVNIPGTSSTFYQTQKDYLDGFLNCTGYRIQGIKTIPGTGVCAENVGGYKTHPYKWFQYTSQCCACEVALVYSYSVCLGSIPNAGTCPVTITSSGTSCGTVANFVTWFNSVTNAVATPCGAHGSDSLSNNKQDFFKCILNNQNTTSGTSACTVNGPLATNIQTATAAQLRSQCIEHCDGLYSQFLTSTIDAFHNNGQQIENDPWTLVNVGPGQYQFGTVPYTPSASDVKLSKIYCHVDGMLAACKSNCTITVQSNGQLGSATEIQNMQNLITGQFLVSTAAGTTPYCIEGYKSASGTSDSIARVLVLMLNDELAKQREKLGGTGAWWNFYNFLNKISSSYSSYFISNYKVYVHANIPSYFGLTPGTSSGNKISYYLNKNRTSSGTIIPKEIYSMSLVPSSLNFVYTSTSNVIVDTIVSHYNPGYIFSTDFVPVTTTSSGTVMLVPDALLDSQTNGSGASFTILPSTSLIKYTNTGTFVNGYWVYDVTTKDIIGTNKCSGRICYKIQQSGLPVGEEKLDLTPTTCAAQTLNDIANAINSQISTIVSDYGTKLKNIYKNTCVNNLIDHFTADYSLKYHHYTLYYYDRAGNLVKTVPPAGITTTTTDRLTHPAHAMITEYEYNSLAQLIRQKTPDAGETKFWYDVKGRLRFSQNAKQLVEGNFSYTKYDVLGRITEVGEITTTLSSITNNLNNLTYPAIGTGKDITTTIYNTPATGVNYFGNKPQRYLQNRVSYAFTDRDGDLATTGDQVSSYYSYDPHGNVEWMIQDIPEIGRNYIGYDYDLISGSVIKVRYNEELNDRFYHKYSYDVDKRIQSVETSSDDIFWEKDANYSYYLHGPLKRTLIGHDKIQGLDYIYTINGWLKALNGSSLSMDPGGDAGLANENMYVAKDAYSMVLGYYSNDYYSKTSLLNSSSALSFNGTNLYNGNISSWVQAFDNNAMSAGMASNFVYSSKRTGRLFRYDELNRLSTSLFYSQHPTSFAWSTLDDYGESFRYDANGNVKEYHKNGVSNNLQLDRLTYYYYTQSGGTYNPSSAAPAPSTDVTNKLAYVTDAYSSSNYADDIDSQSSLNYKYDEIGNLRSDVAEGISSITWNVYGKIARITKTGANAIITFLYDAAGNRVYKRSDTPILPIFGTTTTYYVKDATGNSMAVYERTNTGIGTSTYTATYTLKEQAIYGSDRLGMKNSGAIRTVTFTPTTPPPPLLNPPIFHTSSYPNIMLPLGNNTMKQVFSRDLYTIPTTISLGANEYMQTVPGTSATVTYDHGNSQAMAYDGSGNVILSAFAYKILTSSVYTGSLTVIYINDKLKIANVPVDLFNSPDAQAVFMKKPGTSDEYYFFTIGTDGKPYYHIIDASIGSVISYNNLLDNNTDYGKTMTLFEDRVGQGNSTLYLKRFGSSSSRLQMFSIDQTGINKLPEITIGSAVASSSNGEIQISPSGKYLVIANTKSGPNGEIRLYNLSSNHQAITSVGSRTFTGTAKSVEFSDNDASLFYTTKNGSTVKMLRLPVATFGTATPFTMHTQTTTNMAGAIRKGVNGKLYYITNTTASAATCTVNLFTNPDAANTVLTSALNGISIGSMPVQPHLLDYDIPATDILVYNRELDKKEYEHKDHLGNIHTTFKDYKVRFANTSSDIAYEETFDDGTSGGFVPSSSGISAVNIDNTLRVYASSSSGLTVNKTITLPNTLGGKFLLSFDYFPGTCANALYRIDNLSTLGSIYGTLAVEGRNDFVVNVPSGTGTIDFKFVYSDPNPGNSFYIDNILIKKLDEPNSYSISQVLNETFTTASNWVATNTNIVYLPNQTLKISKDVAGESEYSASKSVNLIKDQLYKVIFTVTNLSNMSPSPQTPGSNILYFGYKNEDGSQSLDFTTPVANTATGTYTYYVVPKTNRGNMYFSIINKGGGNFECEIDNFKVIHVNAPFQPLYSAVLNNVTDYYAFGSPMPGRQVNAPNYNYGFAGKLKDDEIKGAGNSYDFDARMYDPRLGRWLSIDPQASKGANQTPYCYSFNSPISYSDPDGEWAEVHTKKFYLAKDGVTLIQKTGFFDIFRKTVKIEKDVIVHNAKLYYDVNDKSKITQTQKEGFAKAIENNIVSTWQKSADEDNTERKNQTVEVKVAFEGGIQVVNDLKEVNSTGKKSDHLFIITDDAVVENFGTILSTDDAAGLSYGHLTILSRSQGLSGKTPAHEMGHSGSLPDDPNGYLMDEGGSNPSSKEKRDFYKGGDKKGGFKNVLNKYERKKEKYGK